MYRRHPVDGRGDRRCMTSPVSCSGWPLPSRSTASWMWSSSRTSNAAWAGAAVGSNGRPAVPEFNRARALGGMLLLGLVVALALIDAFRPDFTVDSIQFGLLLGTALLLLGVEAGRKLIG